MKEPNTRTQRVTSSTTVIPAAELLKEGVYFSAKNELMQIKSIDEDKKEMNIFNISEQTMHYFVKFDRHNLVKRVR
jgi:hypothetical protein